MTPPWIKRLTARADAALFTLEHRTDHIIIGWLLLAGLVSALRLVASPLPVAAMGFGGIAPFALLVLVPAAALALALRWFADADHQGQPALRLPFPGRWRDVPRDEARSHRLYGPRGIMVSLLIGMLLNVPVRAIEYLTAMPPVPNDAQGWIAMLHVALTFDVLLFTSLYAIAFAAALRRAPVFPRLLVAIWICDLGVQAGIAQFVGAAGLPAAVAGALETLLMGNVNKVLISAALWMPYLLLSKRVNVTYRHRIPA